MTLSKQVEESLKDAESSLRNALAFSARSERPMVNSIISELIQKIDILISTNSILDKLEDYKNGWGSLRHYKKDE